MNKKWTRSLVLVIIIVMLTATMTACSGNKADDNTIHIGGKNFTEQFIMAEMFKILIDENTDLKTDITLNLAGSVIFDAIKSKEIDVYLEYTGTALTNLGHEAITDPDEVYRIVKEDLSSNLGIEILKPYGFNNTYAMAVTKETADKYGLVNVSDMAANGKDLVLGCTYVFTERDDGYPGLSKHYNFEFKDVKGMDPALMYQALVQGDVDVISAFATEGRIVAFDLVLLEDDKQFFPPYDAAPLIRQEVLEKHPELRDILNSLGGHIDDLKMAELNAAVDLDKREPADVAREFLIEEGIIEK
ncbi:MAG: glycine betaine ABC transporter substrate-binding protein [Gudongella sp.]|jgi:glycine betaine/choline ABC-type transport system substrate-binding protein|nr:glycine betaine ABC transporter substrate-binding protein [Gudongella sp.]